MSTRSSSTDHKIHLSRVHHAACASRIARTLATAFEQIVPRIQPNGYLSGRFYPLIEREGLRGASIVPVNRPAAREALHLLFLGPGHASTLGLDFARRRARGAVRAGGRGFRGADVPC